MLDTGQEHGPERGVLPQLLPHIIGVFRVPAVATRFHGERIELRMCRPPSLPDLSQAYVIGRTLGSNFPPYAALPAPGQPGAGERAA
jgi:hypothetical protein